MMLARGFFLVLFVWFAAAGSTWDGQQVEDDEWTVRMLEAKAFGRKTHPMLVLDNPEKKDAKTGAGAPKKQTNKTDDGINIYPPFPGVNIKGDPSIGKGKHDLRVYQRLTLPNGLRVLLISNPESPKAAASMDIGAGYFQDPRDIPGLAHFLEHMLFLGTKKYPKESEFEEFIEKHGGSNNAYTDMEHTNFYFDILPNDLEGALDRFAQFFIEPKLSESNCGREMNAVNAEHKKNIQNDGWRSVEINRQISNKTMDYGKFGTGDVKTLGHHPNDVMVKKLRSFWKKHYTAKNMQLVVIGGHDLNTLATWVSNSFSAVPATKEKHVFHDRTQTYPSNHKYIYDQSLLGSAVYFEPVKTLRKVMLQWAVPPQILHYRAGVSGYLTNLLEPMGANTISTVLKKKGWVRELSAGLAVSTKTFGLFQIEVNLSEKGMGHVDDIVGIIFKAIDAAKSKAAFKKWRFEQLKKLTKINFDWKGMENPMTYVSSISSNIRWYRPEDAITGTTLYWNFDEKHVREMLDIMTPKNMIMFVNARGVSKTHALDKSEEHYGIKYGIEKIDKSLLKRWERQAKDHRLEDKTATLALIKSNKWIPSEKSLEIKSFFDIRSGTFRSSVPDGSAVHIAPPQIIYESQSPATRLWFRQDAKFKRPVVYGQIRLWTPIVRSSARASVLTLMYCRVLLDGLQEYMYPSAAAGYDFGISSDKEGLSISLLGYSEGLLPYFSHIADKMSNSFEPIKARFESLKEETLEQLSNSKFMAPYKYAKSVAHLMMGQSQPCSEITQAMNAITYEDLKAWPRQMFADVRLEALFNGNIYPWEARAFIKKTQTLLPLATISTSYAPLHRALMPWKYHRPMLDGVYTLETAIPNAKDSNSMLYNIYQTGAGGDVENLYVQLLDMLMSKPTYGVLRTKEQLGYIVWSMGASVSNVQEFIVQVQSSSFMPDHLHERTTNFIESYRSKLRASLSENPKKFVHQVITLYESKMTNSTTLTEETHGYWSAILSQRYNFLQRFEDAQLLFKSITIQGFLEFFDKTFGFNGHPKRSLSIQIASSVPHKNATAAATHGRKLSKSTVTDEETEKQSKKKVVLHKKAGDKAAEKAKATADAKIKTASSGKDKAELEFDVASKDLAKLSFIATKGQEVDSESEDMADSVEDTVSQILTMESHSAEDVARAAFNAGSHLRAALRRDRKAINHADLLVNHRSESMIEMSGSEDIVPDTMVDKDETVADDVMTNIMSDSADSDFHESKGDGNGQHAVQQEQKAPSFESVLMEKPKKHGSSGKRYDGKDSDRAVVLTHTTFQRNGESVTNVRRLSTAVLPQVRTSMFLYPRSDAGAVPPVVSVPGSRPTDKSFLALKSSSKGKRMQSFIDTHAKADVGVVADAERQLRGAMRAGGIDNLSALKTPQGIMALERRLDSIYTHTHAQAHMSAMRSKVEESERSEDV